MRSTQLRRALTWPVSIGAPSPKIQLHLFARLAFQSVNPLWPRRSQLAHKALHRLVRIAEAVFLNQILVDALGAQAHFYLGQDHFGQRFTLAPAASAFAGGQNGWF